MRQLHYKNTIRGKQVVTACLLWTLNLLTTMAAAQEKKYTAASIDSLFRENMSASGMVGMGASIIINNKVVWSKGYGYADKDKKIPFTPKTIMYVASISKTFTGVCVMKAVEEGLLSLDADINTYLPFKVVNPYFPNERITLRSISTHTSGINDHEPTYTDSYYYGGDSPVGLGDFLQSYFEPEGSRYSKNNFLPHKPGTYREYCNIAVGLAGYIVERVTGMSLNEYSKKVIFKPLKMKDTGWLLSQINQEKHSRLYDKQGDSLKQIPLYGVPTYPDGGIRTSVEELSKYFIALLNKGAYGGKRILKQSSIDTMQRLQFTPANKPENVNPAKLNSGLFWATKDGGTKLGYGGTDPGVKTEMLSDLSKEVGVILFTNTSLSEKDLLKYYFGIYHELWKYAAQLKQEKTGNQ
ncbi:beta-lactamase family protein [Terrimonas sp. NA20]|uniref:Beta-lactamase family protein n=1 Tax=Terrimonas ginsenosidimutans TaxID=2908004 RepID=A0ABS9L0N6_9BACT|nr:serine hydrolase domain-containing protein [Terrimonas ginsenosidimutans]MCG2618179.1 beta-lactamase family protein [Terrimonas ginsenosidimutans]